MATKQEGSSLPTDKQRSLSLSNFSRSIKGSWVGRNWQIVLILAMFVLLALFVRSYYAYSVSVDNDYLLSGGSDSYYHLRVIKYVVDTGDQLLWDNMLNYPTGMMNPRPPLYDWSVAVSGMFAQSVTGCDIDDAIGMSLVFSTAIWGALTVIPVYLIGNAAFGRKAGLLSAFLFATMAGHIERSVLSNADHDSMVLFFVVFLFYFLLRSLQTINGTNWVSRWRDRKEIVSGLKGYLGTNQLSLIYAALGGLCMAAVAMIWTGYTYLLIIIVVYLGVQLLVDRFRNVDSMGVTISISLLLGISFLLTLPVYVNMDIWATWYDVPLYIFLVAAFIGVIFTVTRNYPWTLVLPVLAVVGIIAAAVLSVVYPSFLEAIASGQGYLVKSKMYSTISEAQAPEFSTLAMSFGMVTFWLSLIGVGWAAIKIPKHLSPYFIFVVVWSAVAIYMASSAARFLFNASPAFAITAGWILAYIIDRLKFNEMIQNLRGDHGGVWKTIRYSVKLKHVIGTLFLVFMVLTPNVYYALDASIPSNVKNDYDLEIYSAMPGFLQAADYDTANGSSYYLGAFNFGVTTSDQYTADAYSWLSEQDAGILEETDRPAYLSWWDYGFEAINEGGHPAVADNFQNGYQFVATYLLTQTEEGAVALLITRCAESDLTGSGTVHNELVAALESYGVDSTKLTEILNNPSKYVGVILADPDTYGDYSDDLTSGCAMYIAAREYLEDTLGMDDLSALYNDVREITGNDIGYISIDSQLFPFSATDSNIFYAIAKLGDYIMDDNGIPTQFYSIVAVDYYGNEIQLDDVTSDDVIVDYAIYYTEAFYDTMIYKYLMGYGPTDVGYDDLQSLPGISGDLEDSYSMQCWNMTNYRVVYRTAYYNPYSSEDVANHTDAWVAVSYEEAVSLYNKISAGTVTGTVDLSSSSLEAGVVIVQYYDGALVSGTATDGDGNPIADAWVTIYDEYGIPHQVTKTDSDGYYTLLAPFGNCTVVFSYGDLDSLTLTGTELYSETIYVTYDQAMQEEVDSDKDGQLDYYIDLDVIITVGTLDGNVYIDIDGDEEYTSDTDVALVGAIVTFENETTGYSVSTVTGSDGYYVLDGINPMEGNLSVEYEGHYFGDEAATSALETTTTTDLICEPASVSGTITLEGGTVANEVTIYLLDQANNEVLETTTDTSGGYSFEGLLPGNYTVQTDDGSVFVDSVVQLDAGDDTDLDLVMYESMRLSGTVTYNGEYVANALIGITTDYGTTWAMSDSRGRYSVVVPKGDVSFYATATVDGVDTVFLSVISATTSRTLNVQLSEAIVLTGTVNSGTSASSDSTVRIQSRNTGAIYTAVTNSTGVFRVVLPADLYFVYIYDDTRSYWGDVYFSSSTAMTFNLVSSSTVYGSAWYDDDGNGATGSGEYVNGVLVTISDNSGRSVTVSTDSSGDYSFLLVSGKAYTLTATKDGYDQITKTYTSLDTSVSKDLELIAKEVTVTGTISNGLSGITVDFTAVDDTAAITKTVVTTTGGAFTVKLSPGDYIVTIDQNVTSGSTSVRYQTLSDIDLTISVGEEANEMSIDVVKRYLVSGTISPTGTITMVFDGTDTETLTVSSTYSVYLQEGTYSLYVKVVTSSLRYADLSQVDVSGAMSLDISAASAVQTIFTAQFPDTVIESVNLSIESGGAYYNVTTSSAGLTSVYLPAGTYDVSIVHYTMATIDGMERYVVYTGNTTFTMASTIKSIIISLDRALDNATMQGTIYSHGTATPSTLMFQAISETAIDLTVDVSTGTYSVELAPGNYTVYALSSDKTMAYIGTMVVEDAETYYNNLTLVQAYRLSGTTFANDEGVSASISISGDDVSYYNITSSGSGKYNVYLPAGTYTLAAEAQLVEASLNTTYSAEVSVEVDESTSKGISMEKETTLGVEVTWDDGQQTWLSADETAVYTIRITNQGNVEDTYTITASGTGWTVELSESEVTIGYGSEYTKTVTVYITASSSTLVDHSTVKVTVTSTTDTTVTDYVKLDANVTASYAVSMTYSDGEDTDGTSYVYNLEISNDGNADDTYTVTIGNLEELEALGWEVKLVDDDGNLVDSLSIDVDADDSGEFQVSLVSLRDNPDTTISVLLVAESKGDEYVVATLVMEPEFAGISVDNGLSITGDDIASSMPEFGDYTFILMCVMLTFAAVLLTVTIKKGVFSRRK